MQTVANQLTAVSATQVIPFFLPLDTANRPTVITGEAAYYLNRQPQTLRSWASLENGPIYHPRYFHRWRKWCNYSARLLDMDSIRQYSIYTDIHKRSKP